MSTYLEKGSGNRYTLRPQDSDAARDEELEGAAVSDEAERDEIDATVAAKRTAEELNVDIADVQGSGKDDRVTAPDVEAHAEKQSGSAQSGMMKTGDLA